MDYKILIAYINQVAEGHQEKINKFGKTIRNLPKGDNPYFIHPVWCATMMLHEPTLEDSIRVPGAIALLFHDIPEDTTLSLPTDLPEKSKVLIEAMTVAKEEKYNYSSWEKEKLTILEKPIEVQLLKLYDKTATLCDMAIKQERIEEWCHIVSKLAENVQKEYGNLNIVILAKAIVSERVGNKLYD